VNAVEVTKLSLLLKVLEDENKDVLEQQQKLYQEKVLPNLSYNIKCGNSLIGTDILEQENLEHEDVLKLNPFNWEHEFPLVFANGGFDAIIGNPPYIRTQLLDKISKKYYKNNYMSSTGIYDIYALFVEKSISITKKGLVGFILPNKFILADYGKGMRELIKEKSCLHKLINFKDNQIFHNASTYTCLLFLKSNSKHFKYSEIDDFSSKMLSLINGYDEYDDGNITIGLLNNDAYSESDWKFYIGKSAGIVKKMMDYPLKLNDVCDKIFQGLATSADKVYIVDKVSEEDNLVKIYSKMSETNHLIEKELLKRYIKGKEIKRYGFDYKEKLLLFPYILNDDNYELIQPKELKKNYPHAWKYLKTNEKVLKEREHGKMNNRNKWYAFTYPKSMLDYRNPKIMTPNSAFDSSFSFDKYGDYYITAGISGGYGLKLKKECGLDELYLLPILNSSLMTFLNRKIGKSMRGKYYSYEGRVIGNYPIIELSAVEQQDFIELAEKMLKLNKKLQLVKTPQEEKLLRIQVDNLDSQINAKVYELYGLTSDEISIVEDSIKN
ncbi:Eco57I restriction-modification methylase domain-containing protein, partial [Methanobrevibacter sp.]|uniref:Eco57I restriction-modification methylase domain-containing protein n=1 Tax=Methanobrevibacter sp. TaxID=66852 RepID=UPI002E77DD8E